MKLKPGVRVQGLGPETALAMMITAAVYDQQQLTLTITSVVEGQHRRGSLHYVGAAFDCRLPPAEYLDGIVSTLDAYLGDDFDVVPEATHIHIEYQPKKAY